MNMIRTIISASLFFITLTGYALAESSSCSLQPGLTVLATAGADNRLIARLEIVLEGPHVTTVPEFTWDGWGSTAKGIPGKTVSQLRLVVRGEELVLSRSAYADLASINCASLTQTADGWQVELTGGDAATGFKAQLQFDLKAIKARRVASTEFPDDAYEVTEYRFNM